MSSDHNEIPPNSSSFNASAATNPYNAMNSLRYPIFPPVDLSTQLRLVVPNPQNFISPSQIEHFDNSKIPLRLCGDTINVSPRHYFQQTIRPDYNSSLPPHDTPFQNIPTATNLSVFPSLTIPQSSNPYRIFQQLPYQLSPPYINGYNSCASQIPSMARPTMIPMPISQPSSSNQDPLLEHNYTRHANLKSKEISLDTDIKLEPKKRPAVHSSDDLEKATSIDFSPKKKKSYTPVRELIKLPISQGFIRELITSELPDAPRKKLVIYKTPDGKILGKKQDVRNYLVANPSLPFTTDHFCFDIRFNLTPKVRAPPKQQKSKSPLSSPIKGKTRACKPKNDSNDVKPESNSPKRLSIYLKNLINRHFKRFSDKQKFFDGLSSTSYRRKLPSFKNCSIVVESLQDAGETSDLLSDLICVNEFLSNYSVSLKIDIQDICLSDFLSSLAFDDLNDSQYLIIFEQLLRAIIKYDNFIHEIASLFFLENIFSLKWNWLLIDQIFKLYVQRRKSYFLSIPSLPETPYHKHLLKLFSLVETLPLFCFSTPTKAFALRFLVDQISSTYTFACLMNEAVENCAKNRREKFQVDTKIRQLKARLSLASKSTNDTKEESDEKCSDPVLQSQYEELDQLELDHERLRLQLDKLSTSLRSLLLGFDRYGRMYFFLDSQKAILIEGLASYPGLTHTTFSSPQIYKKNSDLLFSDVFTSIYLSDQLHGRLKIDDYHFESTNFNTIIDSSASVEPLDQKTQSLLTLLLDYPKLIKDASEDKFSLLVDYFNDTYTKIHKKCLQSNEYGRGWWIIDDTSILNELIKSLNQRGIHEHALYKSLIKYNEIFTTFELLPQNLINLNIACQSKFTPQDIQNAANDVIFDELKDLSIKMDKYLTKIGIENFQTLESNVSKASSTNSNHDIIKNLINGFVNICERKFDRPWLAKWNESLQHHQDSGAIYLHILSLKLKIDPNAKICTLCSFINEGSIVQECSVCLLCAHEACLDQPMRKLKKTRLICSKCHHNSVQRSNRICRACGVKTGKTFDCSVCSQIYHLKCLGNKPKNKLDPIICEACALATRILNPKIYTPPDIDYPRSQFKPHSAKCLELLNLLQSHKDAQPFLEPVDPSIPSYYEIIKKPMCFHDIHRKIKCHKYKTISRFAKDILQVFENCHVFNEDNSKVCFLNIQIAKCGSRLQKIFEKEWKQLCSSLSL